MENGANRDRSPLRDDEDRKGGMMGRRDGGIRRRGGGSGRSSHDRRIYVSNVPFDYKWQDVRDLFNKEVGGVTHVDMFFDEKDRPRGCGTVEFQDEEYVEKAIEKMHRYELKDRKIVVKRDYECERDRYGRLLKENDRDGSPPRGPRGGDFVRRRDDSRDRRDNLGHPHIRNISAGGDPAAKFGNTYGLSVAFLESLHIDGPLLNRVFVANLSYEVDEAKLREVFRLAGKVVNVELNRDKDGKSRGHGIVEYDHPVEAVQAISMFHEQVLMDRKMSVRMDRVRQEPGGLPSKLPLGLKSIGMGLGAGGAPLQNVASNLPYQNAGAGLGPGVTGNYSSAAPVPPPSAPAPSAAVGALGLPGGNLSSLAALTQGAGGLGLLNAANPAVQAQFSLAGLSAGQLSSLGAISSNDLMASQAGLMGLTGNPSTTGLGLLGSGPNKPMVGSNVGPRPGPAGSPGSMDRYSQGPMQMSGSHGMSRTSTGLTQRKVSDTVIIRNLPPSFSWQSLKDMFRDIGDVKFAELREKGTGMIRFASERDADRAVNLMDQSRLDGRVIDVFLY